MISKGMPRTIDLTDNRDFRQGVEPVGYIGNPVMPGKVPWDSSGYDFQRNTRRYHEMRRTLDITFDTTADDWAEFSQDTFDSTDIWYTDSDYKYSERQYNLVSAKRVHLTTDPESIIPYLKNFEFSVTHSGVYVHSSPAWQWNATAFDEYTNTYTNIGCSNVTPDILTLGTLTEEEFNGEVILTGKGLALREKILLYRYLKAIQKILDDYNKTHRKFNVCDCCKNPIVIPYTVDDKKYTKFCWRCANKVVPHKFVMTQTLRHFRTVNLVKCKMLGRTTSLREIYRRNITFEQPFYRDRGLSLISNNNRVREMAPRNVALGYSVVPDIISILEHL